MVIINPSFATQPAALNRPSGPAPVLAIDRVLSAVVVGQRADHLYELASGNLRMMAESQTALRHGEKLLLQVTGKDHKQRPQLLILKADANFISKQLRTTLPQQQSTTQLLSALSAVNARATSPALTTLIDEFLSTLPSKAQASNPNELRQAILQSGLFLESQLNKGEAPSRDIKRALLRLNQQLSQQLGNEPLSESSNRSGPKVDDKPLQLPREYAPLTRAASVPPTPIANKSIATNSYVDNSVNNTKMQELPGQLHAQGRQPISIIDSDSNTEVLQQLLRDVRGSLARQESHQLQFLQQNDKHQTQFMIELPVRSDDGTDLWQLQFYKPTQTEDEHKNQEKAASCSDKPQHNWIINLSFDLPGLGPLKARISQAPNLDIRFSTDKPETMALINAQRHDLEERLSAQGVPTQSIQCSAEPISENTPSLYPQTLLDTQA
ncbi:flagellar hook-length control protein FliK [Zhongshania aliphaticivorans]|uniref:flagellar hook-length control protein FliK n=1 Tax=Zhongshania aliphaticivorans TaxID=1470434 RepID=UPI0012E68788|nr:flagellar hook-length control protein FliK [Zhongshania aliphaticivorans]CAA0082604.1 Uncharacterised protein [Zhongshania aliphaticivorans]